MVGFAGVRPTYVVDRPVVNSYLVRERDRRRLRELFLVVLLGVLLGLCLLSYTWLQVELLASGYRAGELEQRLHGLERIERELRLEASYLASPQRIERRATEELGMRPPTLEQMVFLEGSR